VTGFMYRIRVACALTAAVTLCVVSASSAVAEENATAQLTLEMSTDAEAFEGGFIAEYGIAVEYQFLVTNSGEVAVVDISVDEPTLGHIGDIAELAPGDAQLLTISSTSAEGDFTGTAAGRDPSGEEVTASATITVERFFGDTFEDDPWIRKSASVSVAEAGETVRYTLTYGNQTDWLIGETAIIDDFDERVFEVVDAGGAKLVPGRLEWAIPAGLTPAQGPRTITYALRVRKDAPSAITSALNVATISNESDIDASDNVARVWITIDAYLGFSPPPAAPTTQESAGSSRPISRAATTPSTAAEDPDFLPFTGGNSAYQLYVAVACALAGVGLRRLGSEPV